MPQYARLWTDILDDPKLILAVRNGAKHLVFLPWLIAFAKRAGASGRIEIDGKPADFRIIARAIPNASAKKIAKSMAELETIHVLEKELDGCYRFVAWEYRNEGKSSDSKQAVRERVQRHRERKRRRLNPNDVTPSNALQGVTRVTPNREKREERRKKREESRKERVEKKSGVVGKDLLPPAAAKFGRCFYGAAPLSRKRDIKRQLLATLNGGARLRRGVKVLAGSIERLEAKCREVITEGVRDPETAIVVLLTKLADVSDDSPTERAAAESKRDEAEAQRRFELAMAWIRENPEIELEIDERVNAELGEQPDKQLGVIAKRMVHRAVVIKAWTDAGEPQPEPTHANVQ